MQITWKLRMAAAQREVWTGAQLQAAAGRESRIGAVVGVGVGVVHQATQPDQAVHPDRVVHRPGVHPRRPVRRRHHPCRATGYVDVDQGCQRLTAVAAGPVDAADLRMTRRIRDCQRCGRAVGKPERDLCARCHWARAHAPDKHRCPDCGADRVLQAGTGRCVRCSRTCRRCDAPVLFVDRDLCKECARRDRLDAHRVACPRCGKRRVLRPTTGWCGSCSHPGRPPNPDAACVDCGQVTRLAGAGRCRTCWASLAAPDRGARRQRCRGSERPT